MNATYVLRSTRLCSFMLAIAVCTLLAIPRSATACPACDSDGCLPPCSDLADKFKDVNVFTECDMDKVAKNAVMYAVELKMATGAVDGLEFGPYVGYFWVTNQEERDKADDYGENGGSEPSNLFLKLCFATATADDEGGKWEEGDSGLYAGGNLYTDIGGESNSPWKITTPRGTIQYDGTDTVTYTDSNGRSHTVKSSAVGMTETRGATQRAMTFTTTGSKTENKVNGITTQTVYIHDVEDATPSRTRRRTTTVDFNSDGTKRYNTIIQVYYPGDHTDVDLRGQHYFVVEAADVVRYLLDGNLDDGIDPTEPGAECGLDTVADGELLSYATATYLDYDTDGRVLKMTGDPGASCGSCGDGSDGEAGTYYYRYGTSGDLEYEATLSPSGNITVEFTNDQNQTVYEVIQADVDGTLTYWITHHVYDSQDHRIETRHPSACAGAGYTVSTTEDTTTIAGTTLYWPTGVTTGATGTTGKVDVFTYTQIDANDENSWKLTAQKLREGVSGTRVYWVRAYEYGTNGTTTYNYTTLRRVTKQIEYPILTTSSTHSGRRETTYSYTYYQDEGADTHVVAFKKITHPVVVTAANGSGVATTTIYHYYSGYPIDSDGDQVDDPEDYLYYQDWIQGPDGSLSYSRPSLQHGGTLRSMRDVATDGSGNVSGETDVGGNSLQAPLDPWSSTRWTNTDGVHLLTTYTYDSYGRRETVTSPSGSKTKFAQMGMNQTSDGKETTTAVTSLRATLDPDDHDHYDDLPVSINVSDMAGRTTISARGLSADATDGNLTDDWTASATTLDTAFNGTLVSRTESNYNDAGQLTSTVRWTDADDTNAHKYTTSYAYYGSSDDHPGMLKQVTDETGNITRTVYDEIGRTIESKLGTSDANLVTVSKVFYDDAEDNSGTTQVGDGHVTHTRQYHGTGVNDYHATDTTYRFDGRKLTTRGHDRLLTSWSEYYSPSNHLLIHSDMVHFDADNDKIADSTELRAFTYTIFDKLGRMIYMQTYEVNDLGNIGHKMANQRVWYDAAGRVIKKAGPNGLFQKTQYDSAGRVVATYTSYDDDETTYADADDVTGDTVIEQTQTVYNDAGQAFIRSTFQRHHSDTTTEGALTTSSARYGVAATWFDKYGRTVKSVSYGTNGSTIIDDEEDDFDPQTTGTQNYASGGPNPNTSDLYIVSKQSETWSATAPHHFADTWDNLNRQSRGILDDLGRTVKTIENYVDGTVSETETDSDRTTEYEFDSTGRQVTLIAYNPKGSGNGVEAQKTCYLHGTTVSEATPDIYRNDVLAIEVYPDANASLSQNATTKVWSVDSGTDYVKYTYDVMGRRETMTDQRGVTHTYTYNDTAGVGAGQLASDAITNCPAGVDNTVLRIQYTYDDRGRRTHVTSYDAATGGNVINEVLHEYKDDSGYFGNLYRSYQNHSGAVNTQTTLYVQYDYDDGYSGGAKYQRLTKVTYPNGREVHYNYPSSGIGHILSRVDNIADDASGTTKYGQYAYLGAGTIVKVEHPAVTGGLVLDYTNPGGSGSTSYDGFDRFGRVVNQKWSNDAGTTIKDQFLYAYDRGGNRTSRDIPTAVYASNDKDQYYTYDDLQRLASYNRGALASGVITDANANYNQDWQSLESLGNWRSFRWDANGGGDSWTTQSRTHNVANELTAISGTGADWIDPVYDAAGNMTSGPKPGSETTRIHFTYDAWNRMVNVKNDNGGNPGTTVCTMKYDGLSRRTTRVGNSTHTYYYNTNWQEIEERKNGDADPLEHLIWDLRYIDAPIVRWRDWNMDGTIDFNEYYCNDANMNVTALVAASNGNVTERYEYDPYGMPTVLDADFSADSNGIPDTWNLQMFQGRVWDHAVGVYDVRHRVYHPTMGRWVQRDPAGYVDGANLQEYVRSRPLEFGDFSGLALMPFHVGAHNFTLPEEGGTYVHNVTIPIKIALAGKYLVAVEGFAHLSVTIKATPNSLTWLQCHNEPVTWDSEDWEMETKYVRQGRRVHERQVWWDRKVKRSDGGGKGLLSIMGGLRYPSLRLDIVVSDSATAKGLYLVPEPQCKCYDIEFEGVHLTSVKTHYGKAVAVGVVAGLTVRLGVMAAKAMLKRAKEVPRYLWESQKKYDVPQSPRNPRRPKPPIRDPRRQPIQS